jgi:hypothetical protein
MQPGIISLTVSSAEDACGFALLEWPQCNFIKKIPSCNSRRGFYLGIINSYFSLIINLLVLIFLLFLLYLPNLRTLKLLN